MKTSTLLIALVALNSGVLASQISTVIAGISPIVLGVSELILVVGYYVHTILKNVRNAFDVNISM